MIFVNIKTSAAFCRYSFFRIMEDICSVLIIHKFLKAIRKFKMHDISKDKTMSDFLHENSCRRIENNENN